jgi:HAD superfamily hydrolase (TIGR01458 family)
MVSPGLDVDGVLLDVDGVLTVSWHAIPGAVEAVAALRRDGIPFKLMTNTTAHTREALAATLRDAGFEEIQAGDVITAPLATAAYLRAHHAGARCFLLGEADVAPDLEGVILVDENPDVVVVAGADDAFTWENLNRALRMLLDGAAFVAMHRNLTWMTDEGLKLDAGAYIAGLELATGAKAEVAGKPAAAFFHSAASLLGLDPERVAMVGDDVETDVLAAQGVGMRGVLVRTGKFRQETLDRASGTPDAVVDSVVDVPALLGR